MGNSDDDFLEERIFLGNVSSAVIVCGMAYGLTLASGFVYLKVLTDIFKSGKNPSSRIDSSFRLSWRIYE